MFRIFDRHFVILVVLALLIAPPAARADDATIHFDELPAGTPVSSQYHAQGIDFTEGPAALPVIVAVDGAVSGTQAATVGTWCSVEFCNTLVHGRFTAPRHHIGVWVRDHATIAAETARVVLTAYDAGGSVVDTDAVIVSSTDGSPRRLDVTSTSQNIWTFELRADGNRKRVAMDDLTFDVPVGPTPPDFTLVWDGSLPVPLRRGGSNTTTLTLHRLGPSTGAIALLPSGLPSGVDVSFGSNPTTGADGSKIHLTLSARSDAPPGAGLPLTITGIPLATAGSAPRSVVVLITVQDSFDARITGIEVTQGIQSMDLPRRGPDVSAPVSYLGGGVDEAGLPLSDSGVILAAGGKTVVRVFANLRIEPADLSPSPFEALLHVCDEVGDNCDAPLKAELGARKLARGTDHVTDSERGDPRGAYTFVLPPHRTAGTVTLKAVLFPPADFAASAIECDSSECLANNTFALKDVRFDAMPEIFVDPIELMVDYQSLTEPDFVFRAAENQVPTATGNFHVPSRYHGQINITDIAKMVIYPGSSLVVSETDRGVLAAERLHDQADDWNHFNDGSLVIGVFDEIQPIRSMRVPPSHPLCLFDCKVGAVAVVGGPRDGVSVDPSHPLTLVAHELFHMLGRKHASSCDGAANADDWPPDQRGYIHGFGLDRRGGVWRAVQLDRPGPYRILAPGRDGAEPLFYDFMSYCADFNGYDPDSWSSVRGWNQTAANFKLWLALLSGFPFSASPPSPAVSGTDGTLVVRGFVTSSGEVVFTKVAPGHGPTVTTPVSSAFHLIARDVVGAVLSDTAMQEGEAEADQGDDLVVVLSAQIPAAGVESIEVVSNGVSLGSRTRSDQVPAVVLSVAPDLQDGTVDEALIRWTVTGNDPSAALLAKVDYSIDGAERWRPLFSGPNEDQALIPRRLLQGSSCGRIRVRVNDGFNESEAVSICLNVPARAPTVAITSPLPGHRVRREVTTYLSGEAHDEALRPVPAANLTWTLAGVTLGHGRAAAARDFPQGRSRLELTAVDENGRSAAAALDIVCGDAGFCGVEVASGDSGQGPSNLGRGWPMARHDARRTGATTGLGNITIPRPYFSSYLGGTTSPQSTLAGDVNLDGAVEVVLAQGNVVARRADDTLVWQSRQLGIQSLLDIADLDGDGKPDIVGWSTDHVYVLDGATGGVQWAQPEGEMGAGATVRMADLDDDGWPELVIRGCGCCGSTLPTDTGVVYSFRPSFASARRLWTFPIGGCGGSSLTIFNADGLDEPEVLTSDYDHLYVRDGMTGTVLAASATLGPRTEMSHCISADIDGLPGEELACILSFFDSPAVNRREVFVLRYSPATASLDRVWSKTLAPGVDGAVAFEKPVADLDGDGELEVIVSGRDASGIWTTHVLDAATGADLATLTGERIASVAPIQEPATSLVLTTGSSGLSAWSFSRSASPPAQKLWTLPGQITFSGLDRTLWRISSLAARAPAMDLNGDGVQDLFTLGAGLTAYSAALGTPATIATFGSPALGSVFDLPPVNRPYPQLAVSRVDGFLTLLDDQLAPTNAASPELPGIRTGGFYHPGRWGAPESIPVVASLDGPAQQILVSNVRGTLQRLDATFASPASPPVKVWEADGVGPAVVPRLDGGNPAIACYASSKLAVRVLRADGTEIWRQPIEAYPRNDLVPANLDGDGTPDLVVQWGNPGDTLLRTRGLSGSNGATLWNAVPIEPGAARQPAGVGVADWNGDGIDDVLHQAIGLRILSGASGAEIQVGGPGDSYFMPMPYDVDGDGTLEVTLMGGYSPARTLEHDLTTLVWTGTEDDRPYPYGSVAVCPDGPRLVEGSSLFPARLKITRMADPSAGSHVTMWLVGGQRHVSKVAAKVLNPGALFGQLTSTAVHENLTGQGHPSALVGSSDGFLYAVDPCTGNLDFAYDFGAAVGQPVFGDLDGDGYDEIVVSVADGFLYGLREAQRLHAAVDGSP